MTTTPIVDVQTRTCSVCEQTKPLEFFYKLEGGRHGRMARCIACNNNRPPTPSRMIRNRARQRAWALLAQAHADEFEQLFLQELEAARTQHEQLQQAAADQDDANVARLRPGPRREGEELLDRLDVARCQRCHTHHDAEHECPDCGSISPEEAPALKPWEIRQWAVAEGIDVPGHGPLPARVVEAYAAEHEVTDLLPQAVPFDEVAIERRLNGDRTVELTVAERRELVRRLHAQGHQDGEIERRTGLSRQTVFRHRKALGLPANEDPHKHPISTIHFSSRRDRSRVS